MKRISLLLALVAVLALAGTAAAGPNVSISGESTLVVSGNTDDLTPSVGGLTFGMKQDISISGDKWSLSGKLYLPHSASLSISDPTETKEVLTRFWVKEVNEGTEEAPDYHYYVEELGWELIQVSGNWVAITGYDDEDNPELVEEFYEIYIDDQDKPVVVVALVSLTYVKDVSGSLTHGSNPWFSLTSWKLTMDAGAAKFAFANGADLTDYGDHLGFISLAKGASGNHMQVTVPLQNLTLVYDKAGAQEGAYVKIAKGVIPAEVIGMYDATTSRYSATVRYDFGGGLWTEIGAVMAQGKTNGAGYGAEVNVPLTQDQSLVAYIVGKQFGSGYTDTALNGRTVTLGQLTYTQPQYKAKAYIWTKFKADGSVEQRDHYLEGSLVQKAGDPLGWYTDWPYNKYRNLKGLGLYAKYDIDSPALVAGLGAPVVPGKAALKLSSPNLLAKDANNKGIVEVNGELYVKLSDKLNSVTNVQYKQGTGVTQLQDTLNYTVSSNSSISLTLTKPTNANRLDYTATFKVSY
ncbi:MAG TPA: hypothetical protein GXX55_08815 [Firmicutes bacterium]|nr:hypothetical protein [Bacillota bacterium]